MPNYVPGSSSTYAHDWSHAGTGGKIERRGRHFVDGYGRVCSLRVSTCLGPAKSKHNHDTFPADHHSVTFVDRPFPLKEAPQHFARLRRWGLSFSDTETSPVRSGIYDMEYLTYIKTLLSMLPKYGLSAFVVLHQDVWSRYSGGSGAPAWTLENIGFDLHALEESGAAWLLGVKGGGHIEAERSIWPSGYQKLAAATMATCFWAGDTFAPKLKITAPNGEVKSVQQYLQDAFLDMYTLIMNEPHRGYIELPSLHEFDYNTNLHLAYVPSAFQSFMLGSGYPTLVSLWTRSFPWPTRVTSRRVLNPDSCSAWRPDGPTQGKCVWEMHGVWGWDKVNNEGVVLRENYFIDWYTDFYYTFLRRWAERVHSVTPKEKMLFVEPISNELCPPSWKDNQLPNMVFAPHWYDLDTLFSKSFGDFTVNVPELTQGKSPLKKGFYWGQKGARDNYSLQIQNIINSGHEVLEAPVLIGECGIPMDLNEKEALQSENWTWQYRMMDAMMTGLERSLASFTLWNYNPDNNDADGDHWNGENFSWFSRRRALPPSLLDFEQSSFTLDNGGRILPSVVRPYPAKTAGIPLKFEYDMNIGKFTFEWTAATTTQERTARETEIYIPSLMTHGRHLVVEGLAPEDKYVYDESRQTLFVVRKIAVSVRPPLRPHFYVNSFWDDFGELILSGLVVFIAMFALIKFRFFM
ncbi:glycoside hydrolase family 5 protein [Melanogaster broomeanus]|nr:glycoside hydrolase family 5 protein [Melanogaster broomeanus]